MATLRCLQKLDMELSLMYYGVRNAIIRWYKNPARYIKLDAELLFEENKGIADTQEQMKRITGKYDDTGKFKNSCNVSITAVPLTGIDYAYGIKVSIDANTKYRMFKKCSYYLWNIILDFEKHFNVKTSYKNIYVKMELDRPIPDIIKQYQEQFPFFIRGTIPGTTVRYRHEDYVSHYEGSVNISTFDRIIQILNSTG